MSRTLVVFFLFVTTILPLEAKRKEEAPPPPAISDQMARSLLQPTEVLRWERGLNLIKEGKDIIANGEWEMNRKASTLGNPEKDKLNNPEANKARGEALIAKGNSLVSQGNQILNELRRIALSRKDSKKEVVVEKSYSLELESIPLEEAIDTASRKMLFELWKENYVRIYSAGTFFLYDRKFEAHEKLNEKMLAKLIEVDGNRYTVVPDTTIKFRLGREGDNVVINFKQRETILRNFKSVIIVSELLFDKTTKRSFLSLRAIDLVNMKLVSSQLKLLALDEYLLDSLYQKDKSLLEEESRQEWTNGLSVQFTDNKNFIERVSKSATPYYFRYEFVGEKNGVSARVASMITKSLIQETSLSFTELDFIEQAFPKDPSVRDEMLETATNAIWAVTPLDAGLGGRHSFDVVARSIRDGKESPDIPLGLLLVSSVKTPTPPTGEETETAELSN